MLVTRSRQLAFAVFLISACLVPYCQAQTTGGGNTNTGNNVNVSGGGNQVSGVQVDANGVLRMRSFQDPTGQLTRQRFAQSRAALDRDIARPSKLRKISLNRLEAIIAERLASNAGITDDMRFLAGLTQLRYVFFFPESNDIVIAGSAEGYGVDLSGRPVGLTTGRSVLELQDLVVALRSFPPNGQPTPVISCSIDPTQEGLQRMQQFMASMSGQFRPGDDQRFAMGLRRSLGQQRVTIEGVPPESHFAQVLVEADYRMKLVGIGLEQLPVNITTFIQKARPNSLARNALCRWFFVPNYESVRVSDDDLAMELVGEGVKLVGEDELVTADGARTQARFADRASLAFVQSFTKKYPEIARRTPVFAQLRNLIDMTIAAAFIQQQDYYARANWEMNVFGNEKFFPVLAYEAPLQVESAVNVVWKGNVLMTPIGGGVKIEANEALARNRLMADEDGEVAAAYEKVDLQQLPADRWWWD